MALQAAFRYNYLIWRKIIVAGTRYSKDNLNQMSSEQKDLVILNMQDQIDAIRKDYTVLLEQFRVFEQERFGRHTEKMDQIEGQMSLFDETENLADLSVPEPDPEEILPPKEPRKKQKGRRKSDLAGLQHETIPAHDVPVEKLDAYYGRGCWRFFGDETYMRLRYVPSQKIVEDHTVKVYVGTNGLHQDEFLRGDRPADPIRNSIATPSMIGAICNGKYVLGLPYERIAAQFQTDGISISKQTMANWVIICCRDYFQPFYNRLKTELLRYHVNQSDETPVQVLHTGDKSRTVSYMWVHRSGEYYKDRPIVLYEYQRTRSSAHPIEFYKNFKGILVTDSLEQYHRVERVLPDIRSANCWAHARRHYSNAIKAMSKKDADAIKQTAAYQALLMIGAIYHADGALKDLSSEERHQKRQTNVKPLVDAYFAWVKQTAASATVLPRSETGKGLNFSINQEKYLRVFLDDGDVPIDDSASERVIKSFTVGRKAWLFFNTEKGANAGACIYSIAETARLNHLNTYWYFTYLISELSELKKKYGAVDETMVDRLLPWSKELPEYCHSKRR